MIVVLVHYKVWINGGHALIDGCYTHKSKIVEIEKFTDLNEMYEDITKVDVLKE